MPFGFTNGLITFQRYINAMLFDYLNEFVSAYIDNIIIYFNNPNKYIKHIR